MRHILKTLLIIILLFTAAGFTGCQNVRRANPPKDINGQSQNHQEENTKRQNNGKVLIDVPIISQKPELKSGCEVTSLAMLLNYAGIQVDKMTLAKNIKKDTTPIVFDEKKNIKEWGDPNDGFVGDITGEKDGFAVYPGPMIELMEQYMPGRSVDLTNQPFDSLTKSIDQKKPVIVWVTIDFEMPKEYEEWEKDGQKIRATLDEHAILLVGYDSNYCYVNNPYNGMKNQQISKDIFIGVWNTMGNMAVSYK